ncbi:hypothetical protein DFH29DRAFT_293376 [Suillus ampliporus]|nr:hypothetical protein DFH29DRAFT_293376 [Suillus ampliporus]
MGGRTFRHGYLPLRMCSGISLSPCISSACAAHGLLRVSRKARGAVFWVCTSASETSFIQNFMTLQRGGIAFDFKFRLIGILEETSWTITNLEIIRPNEISSLHRKRPCSFPHNPTYRTCTVIWNKLDTASSSSQKETIKTGVQNYVSLSPRLLQTRRLCAVSTVLAMNAFPNGTRVFYWASSGEIKYGTVKATNRMADGTQIVVVSVDGEGHAQLPVSSLSKVN